MPICCRYQTEVRRRSRHKGWTNNIELKKPAFDCMIVWVYDCMIRAALYPRPSLHGSLPPNWACSRRLQCCRRSRTRNPSIATCPNVQGQVPSYCGPNTIQNTVYQMHNRHNKTAKYRIKHKSKAYLKALFTHKILCSSRGSPSKHWTWTK